MSDSRLFQPLKVGPVQLSHRIAMAPLTRFRNDDDYTPTPLMTTYYTQRASVPGTLLISEATIISPRAGGYPNVPGISTPQQIAAWRAITDAVHARGCAIFCQLWALGRTANAGVLAATGPGYKVKSSSAVPLADEGAAVPEELTREEIREIVAEYAVAARNAIEAGFDGVEIHGGNGYLVDQFLQDTCNRRGDEYGGSVEGRSRFAVEVVRAVVEAVGAERTAVRLSPWNRWQGMGMGKVGAVAQFGDVIRRISAIGKLAYLHLVEARIVGNRDAEEGEEEDGEGETLDFAVDLWDGPLVIAGGITAESARLLADEKFKDKDVITAFGRYFISTPDLPFRVKEGIALSAYDRKTFYTPKTPVGYIDQPFSSEFEALHGVRAQA